MFFPVKSLYVKLLFLQHGHQVSPNVHSLGLLQKILLTGTQLSHLVVKTRQSGMQLVTHHVNRQKLIRSEKKRLAKWFTTLSPKDKAKIIKDVSQLVLSRRTRMCNFLEYKGEYYRPFVGQACSDFPCLLDTKVVYRRYASLFFIAGCSSTDNELITLEIVHRYVEQMDKYYGNVCELDIIFNFQKAYFILDELLLAGEMQESSKKSVLRCISQQDSLEDMEVSGQSEADRKDRHNHGLFIANLQLVSFLPVL